MTIYKKHQYINRAFEYIPSANIKEYDIKSAGFNILKAKKLLSDSQIEYLNGLSKKELNIQIGLIQKSDKSISKAINEGLIEYRKRFFETNNIDSSNVISIKRDAIFVVNTRIKFTKFDNVLFVSKNKYSSYYRIGEGIYAIEFYYSRRNNTLDIKGINDDELHHHKHIISFLKKIIKINEVSNISARRYLYDFADRYRSLKLNKGYYREFKKGGNYRLDNSLQYAYFTIEDTDDINNIIISYNYINVILPLIKLIF